MKKLLSKSKIRIVIASAVTILLSGLSISAVYGEGMQAGKLALALFLSVLAGILIAVDKTLPKTASRILVFLLPLAALCCMEFYTHVPWDLTFLIFLLNYLFYLILYGIWIFIFGQSRWGCVAAPVIPMLAGMGNYFVVSFRSSPVVPWDFFSLGTATSVTDNYSFDTSYRLIFVLIGFVFLMILGEKTRVTIGKWKVRLAMTALAIVLMGSYVSLIQVKAVEDAFGMDDILFTPNVLYRNNGFMAAFFSNLRYLNVEKPEGYSAQAAEEISQKQAEPEEQVTGDKPNILVIMNEAFADLSVYGDFGVSEDFMPFWHSLKENTVRGNLYVSVKGGNTANSEFEFLTGNSMAFMPAGSVPYQQFIKSETPSLASHLKGLGYATAALHPYYDTGWNRDQVYPYFGFEDLYFKKDFPDATTLRGYVDDVSAFDKLVELYEEKPEGKPLFAFEVTMQNHGGYSKEYADLQPEILLTDIPEDRKSTQDHSTEKYLTLIRKSDEAFEQLLNYFQNQDEKTMIVMFGDHQPSDYICNPILRTLGMDPESRNDSLEAFAKGYQVPFVIWTNYDIDEKDGEQMSMNYLSSLVMETAGLPKTAYQNYLSDLQQEFPVVTANFFRRSDSDTLYDNIHSKESVAGEQSLNNYSILQYNDMVDKKNRLSNFFD